MVLLALQYTLQPRLSKRYISPKTNKQSVALAEETVKTAIAAVMFCASRSASASASASTATTTIQQELSQWNLQSSLAIAGLPAVLYAIQGVWQYTAHQYIDPVTFNGLSQTKTLWAAACCYLILGQSQSVPQMGALILLFVSALLFQGAFTTTTTTTTPPTSTTASTTSSISPRFPARSKDWFIKGIFPCLGAAICSGLAGALSQRGLQLTGGHGRDAYLYTMEISVFSALTLLVSLMLPSLSSSSRRPVTTTTKETKKRTWSNPLVLEGWTRATWIPIIWKAAGGVLTALVHQSSGSVAKGFALMLGLVLSGVLQSFIQEEEILPHQVAGTLFVMLSGWVHFTK
jgi:UDP-sugar transporter A1/2/3